MQKQRGHRRRELERDGHISFLGRTGSTTLGCVVKDISASGARLFVCAGSEIPIELKLSVEGISDQDCVVKWNTWRSTGEIAVEFV